MHHHIMSSLKLQKIIENNLKKKVNNDILLCKSHQC